MKKPYPFILIFLLLLLGACNLPQPPAVAQSGPHAWIDAPLDGSSLLLAPYEVVYHGATPGGVAQTEFSVNGEVIATTPNPDPSQPLVTVRYAWQPPGPGNYTLRVRAQDTSGEWSEYAVADISIGGETTTPSPTPEPTATPTPEITNAPLPSETPSEIATLTATATPCTASATFLMNANCRQGPGTGYDVVTSLLEGQTVPVEGRNNAATWWWVQLPESSAHCWVAGSTVKTACLPDDLPLIAVPPLLSEPSASTDTFYWGDCDLRVVTISVDASGDSPIAKVEIIFRVADQNWTTLTMEKSGDLTWSRRLNSHEDIPGGTSYEKTSLQYYFVASNNAGLTTQSQIYQNITLKKCE